MQMRCTKRKGFSAVVHAKITGRVAPSATQSSFHELCQWLDRKIKTTGGQIGFRFHFRLRDHCTGKRTRRWRSSPNDIQVAKSAFHIRCTADRFELGMSRRSAHPIPSSKDAL